MSKTGKQFRRNAARMKDTMASFGIALASVRIARKTGQLCKEVSRTLSCALGASCDELVRDLAVVAVQPAPDAARLLVTVCPLSAGSAGSRDASRILDRLESQRGLLREEVAAALHRKRTPELAFHVALAG